MIRVLGGMEQDRVRFHHAIENGAQFKTFKNFIPEIFHQIFLDHGWLLVTEAMENEIVNYGRLLYLSPILHIVNWDSEKWSDVAKITQ